MLHGELAMTGTGPAIMHAGGMPEAAASEQIETRFGQVTIHRHNPIIFPNGLLGMPDKNQFCLTDFPSERMGRFKLLQSLDDLAVAFITLPVELNNPIVAREDMEQAAQDLGLPLEHLLALFIVSVHRESGAAKLSVNARAPLLVHAQKRVATQYVFVNPKYEIRQPLSL